MKLPKIEGKPQFTQKSPEYNAIIEKKRKAFCIEGYMFQFKKHHDRSSNILKIFFMHRFTNFGCLCQIIIFVYLTYAEKSGTAPCLRQRTVSQPIKQAAPPQQQIDLA